MRLVGSVRSSRADLLLVAQRLVVELHARRPRGRRAYVSTVPTTGPEIEPPVAVDVELELVRGRGGEHDLCAPHVVRDELHLLRAPAVEGAADVHLRVAARKGPCCGRLGLVCRGCAALWCGRGRVRLSIHVDGDRSGRGYSERCNAVVAHVDRLLTAGPKHVAVAPGGHAGLEPAADLGVLSVDDNEAAAASAERYCAAPIVPPVCHPSGVWTLLDALAPPHHACNRSPPVLTLPGLIEAHGYGAVL
mmetsp:Transcript_4316/g.13031  ORF Transcript_4316/g.13031 Transcript_4316/m.13031 type:complete len:248 (-) Transcript_4316:1442-2185(-)